MLREGEKVYIGRMISGGDVPQILQDVPSQSSVRITRERTCRKYVRNVPSPNNVRLTREGTCRK